MSPRTPDGPRPGDRAQPLGLAIDTTFDDTSVALLRGKRELLANVTLSQYAEHAEFGGVVPERASRKHLEVIHPLIRRAFAEAGASAGAAGLGYEDVDYTWPAQVFEDPNPNLGVPSFITPEFCRELKERVWAVFRPEMRKLGA